MNEISILKVKSSFIATNIEKNFDMSLCGVLDFQSEGLWFQAWCAFLKSPENFTGPKSCVMCRMFTN